MKNIGKTFLAAVLGGMLSLGTYQIIESTDSDVSDEKQLPVNYNASPASYTYNNEVSTNVDFSAAAELATPTVVHIRSTIGSKGRANVQQIPQPFRDLFGDDFFGRGQREYRPQPQMAAGSGVIISADGYIITNNHVIDNADEVEVSLNDNRTYKAKVIGTDPTTDLALIKVEEKGLPAITVGNSDNIKVGQWVMAVGNPFNLESTVTAGIISAKGRSINILKGNSAIESFIQTDAAVNPGNSGGALVNLNGELIGINTAIASPTGAYSGYSFAVPSNIMIKVVEDLMEYGTVQRAYLGVIIRELDSKLAKEKDLNIMRGVYVDSLSADGAAKAAGIRAGDVILKVDEKTIYTVPQLQETIGRHRPGDEVAVTVNRNGKELMMNVPLKNLNGNTEIVKAGKSEISRVLGAQFSELSAAEKKDLGIQNGVKISKLYPGILRSQTKIQEGFIITKVNKQRVNSINELMDALENEDGGVLFEGIYPGNPNIYYYGFGLGS